jgi:ATP-dependent Clp protease ATP-binding subunit ClpC
MYPFEQFSESAQKVLIRAQEEARKSNRSYMGTEQLLLGLVGDGDGLAVRVLGNF